MKCFKLKDFGMFSIPKNMHKNIGISPQTEKKNIKNNINYFA